MSRPATGAPRPRRARASDRPRPADLVTVDDYDLGGRRVRMAHRLEEEPALAAAARRTPERRLDRLIVVRESDEYNRALLEGALRQTCARNADAPGVSRVDSAGLAVLNPSFTDFPVKPLGREGASFRAVFFILGNVGWLICSASAAEKHSERGDNDFTACLVQLLTEHHPRRLDALAFARLVRSLDHGPMLAQACAACVDVVTVGDQTLDFRNHRDIAMLLWTVMSMLSAAERDEIVRRHTAGVLDKYRRGEWLKPDKVPFGYRYDEATKRPTVDPSRRRQVEEMLRILASSAAASTKVRRLQRLGVVGTTPAAPSSKIRSLLRWVPLYLTGRWLQRWRNPVLGLTEWMGLPVHKQKDSDPGFFILAYDLGLPDGGWAPEDVLNAALDRKRTPGSRRSRRPKGQLPLCGLRFETAIGPADTRHQMWLSVDHQDYALRARPKPGTT